MKEILIYGMIYGGSILMLVNILLYYRFIRKVEQRGSWDKEKLALAIPMVLLILFLAGYLVVGLFGRPDLVVAAILCGGSLFVFLVIDMLDKVVERVRHNEELLARLEASEQASRAKTFFLSNMSHDIRTPLNAIIGFTQLARRDSVPENEIKEYLRKIDSSGRQLLEIINDVLDMSRIESGHMELREAPADITEIFRDTCEMMEIQMEDKGIRYHTETSDILDSWVICDRHRLNRVLLNLLSNACKFTPDGGEVCASLKQTGKKQGHGQYELRVKDNGIGMSADFKEHIFTPFERERTSTVSGIQGTGLGLSIVKRLVDRMEGTIEVETEPGRGTEFIIKISLPLTAEPAQPAEHTSERPGKTGLMGKHLLLVEDNEINREIAGLILTEAGMTFDAVVNGSQAVDKIAQSPAGTYDGVLMDIQMPVMNGYEAARAIRKLEESGKREIPIIAMTANAFQEDIEKAQEAGMNAHIAKPLDIEKMMDTMNDVLSS